VLTLTRPLGVQRVSVQVRDSDGEDAGRITQQSLRGNETTYAFLGPNGGYLGELQSDNWLSWDMRVVDSRGRRVATITRDFAGLDRNKFSKPDDYVVRISQPVHEPLRTLVVACALSLEVTVRADARLH
jgi:scramblase